MRIARGEQAGQFRVLVFLAAVVLPATLPAGAQPAPTWYRDALPVVQQRCQGCHTTGGIAPFSLESYQTASANRDRIATMVENRLMPPWKANDACRPIAGSRRLSDAEIAVLVGWARGGAAEGDPADAPRSAPLRRDLARVDLTLAMSEPYMPSMSRADDYRCFVLDPKVPGDRDLVGYDIVPGQRAMVHHVLLYGAPRAEALALDAAQPGPGYTCFGGPNVASPTVYGAWVPGTDVTLFPEGTGITIESDRVVVMQVHYNTSHANHAAMAADVTSVRLQFADERVANPALIFPIADLTFVIPPAAPSYSTSVSVRLPADLTIHGVGPHMHTLGRSIRVEAGDQSLVDIPAWDFNWQQLYQFSQALKAPAGTSLKLTCTWSNTTNRVVRWGEGTEDEMCLNYFYLTR